MGAKISNAGTASMKHPATIRINTTANINTVGLDITEVNPSATIWGIPALVRTHPNAWVAATISMIPAAVLTDLNTTFPRDLKLSYL